MKPYVIPRQNDFWPTNFTAHALNSRRRAARIDNQRDNVRPPPGVCPPFDCRNFSELGGKIKRRLYRDNKGERQYLFTKKFRFLS
jgi:hypothetical protein